MRLAKVLIFLLFSVAVATAGNINVEIGGTDGLTSSYITNGCAGAVCVAGNTTGWSEMNYDVHLFMAGHNNTFTPYAGYNGSTAVTGTLASSPQFAMIDDGLAVNGARNYWAPASTTASLDVPIGLDAVNSVSMLLNDMWGYAGAQDTDVTFDFANTSNGSTIDTIVVDLTNSGVGGTSGTGQIQSAVDCSTNCSGYATGAPAISSDPLATLNGSPTTVTVTTESVFSAAYSSSNIAGNTVFAGTSGNINLDALTFTFPAAITQNLYLTEIQVSDPNLATDVSQTALSAITVNVSAPEPSTISLLLAGLGLLGYAGFRRKLV